MTALAHVDVAPLVPAQIAALVAVGAVVVPTRLATPAPREARVPGRVLRWPGLPLVGLTALVAVLWLSLQGDPRRVLAWAWTGLLVGSLALGPVWRAANPLRAASAGVVRALGDPGDDPGGDPGDEAVGEPPAVGAWAATAGLAAVLWVSAAPLAPTAAVVALTVYLLAHLCLAVAYGQTWLGLGDGVEVFSTAVGERTQRHAVYAAVVGVVLHTQVVTTSVWRDVIAGVDHPWWLGLEALLAAVLVGAAATAAELSSRLVAVGYLLAWVLGVVLRVPPVFVEDPTPLQLAHALAAGFVPVLVVLAAHALAARRLGRLSVPLAVSVVAGTLLFGPW